MFKIKNFYFFGNKVEKIEKFDSALNKLFEENNKDKDNNYMAVGIDYERNNEIGSCDLIVKINGTIKVSDDYKYVLKDNQSEIEELIEQQKTLLNKLFSLEL